MRDVISKPSYINESTSIAMNRSENIVYAHDIELQLGIKSSESTVRPVSFLLTDSRMLELPEETLFFAIRGKNNNGHQFVASLYQKGVRLFVVDEQYVRSETIIDAVFFVVPNVIVALQKVAALMRNRFCGKMVGITGSNGKTIVKEWLYHLLWPQMRLVRSPKSYNSQIGVPLSIWQAKPNFQAAIIEAGISMPGEMALLQDLVRPEIGIFTNLGEAHQQNFESLEQKLQEKLILFRDAKMLICSGDSGYIDQIKRLLPSVKLFTWGRNINNKLQILKSEISDDSTILSFGIENKIYTISIPFADQVSVENVMHAISCAICLGADVSQLSQRVFTLQPVEMRLEVKEGRNGMVLVNDFYNSDFQSLVIALNFVERQAGRHNISPIIILSDIHQSGLQPEVLYANIAKLLAEREIEKFIGIGKEIGRYRAFFNDSSQFFESTQQFLSQFTASDFAKQVVLLKGARAFKFEQISKQFESHRHLTSLEINLPAIIYNLNYFRSLLPKDTKVVGMVKAFGYGSGSPDVAQLLAVHGVDYLAVAVVDEGVELRESGIKTPIMVMAPEKGSLDLLVDYHLEPEIYSFLELTEICNYLKRKGISNYPVHLKIDTGMSRLGFMPSEVERLISEISTNKEITITSVFSHLAGADEVELDDFTTTQIETFKGICEKIEDHLGRPVIKHILNSAGSERFSEFAFDMVRLGIGLYGVSAVDKRNLNQVATLKTSVVQLKKIVSGRTVGYGRRGVVRDDATIAILPIGYGDGLNRKMGNGRGYVLINGCKAPYVGNICMDLCMVDVTDIEVQVGDMVTIFGDNLPIWQVADWLDTIPYEVIVSISRRVKRVYVEE